MPTAIRSRHEAPIRASRADPSTQPQTEQERPDDTQRLDQGWLDHVLGRDAPRPAPNPNRVPRDRPAMTPPDRYDDRQDSRPTQ